ncbi:MAG: pyridoxal phosphate-dependent aminotransferase [Acidobacteria bacterium]|nr:MAG: pyridoxal phosphate-dependent aminotransferase [Acidobacteriota bacterium]
MTIAKTIADQLEHASWIRRMFEEGAKLRRERGAENVFDFTLGNPDLEPPPAVIGSAIACLQEGRAGSHAYMPNTGFPEVRRKIAEKLSAATHLKYTEQHVIMTVGAAGGLNTVLKAILDPGDEVIVLAPYFVEYGFYITNHGGKVVIANTSPEFLPDIPAIRRAITERTRAIIINSPNNPTGVVYPPRVLEEFEDLLRSLDQEVLLLSDEPYKALAFSGVRPPEVATFVSQSIQIYSWSKALAIPGERIGYIAISPRVTGADRLFDACSFTHRILGFVNAPALWQWVVAECWDQTVDATIYEEKCDLLWEALRRIGYEVVRPGGAFYLFPKSPIPDDVAFIQILKDEGILAVPGSGFGSPGHFRISLTVPMQTIERAITGFQHAYRRAKSG